MKALICNGLCFYKMEINLFGPISGDVFLTQGENTNDLCILAPLTDERCNYNAMIEYVTIRKLKINSSAGNHYNICTGCNPVK